MMRKHISLIGFAVFLLAASDASGQHELGTPFDLGVGQSATVGADGLRVGFDRIVAEGRCPIGVTCFWEGAATGQLWAEAPLNPPKRFDLSTSLPFQTRTAFAGYIIKLVNVTPYPREDDVIDPLKYVVTVLVVNADGQSVPTEAATWSTIKALYR